MTLSAAISGDITDKELNVIKYLFTTLPVFENSNNDHLSKKIIEKVGISVSVGLSYNKFLAKICSDIDKPRGFSIINKKEASNFLKDKPVEVLWGVGKTLKNKLNNDGIKTIGQIKEMEINEVITKYGAIGSHIHKLSNAEDNRAIKPFRKVPLVKIIDFP